MPSRHRHTTPGAPSRRHREAPTPPLAVPNPTLRPRTARRPALLPVLALLLGLLAAAAPLRAQSWGSSAGLMQGERIARVTTLLDTVLHAASDTTAWLAIGTHTAALAQERPWAPTRFTLFVQADTAGLGAAAGPEVVLQAQLALSDTGTVYEQADGSLEIAPATAPVATTTGQVYPVPVYGGGWLRLIAASTDTARVRLHLWRVR
jgi:hypothetical protein